METLVGEYCGFVDAGYLVAAGARALSLRTNQVRPNAAAVVDWLAGLGPPARADGDALLRTYWYDGAYDSTHSRHASQKRFHDAIALTSGIQVRLGHLAERRSPRMRTPIRAALRNTAVDLGIEPDELVSTFETHWEWRPEHSQKGVDTLLTLDLVRLGQSGASETAVLVTGGRDLAEAVRTVQDLGRRVVIASPRRSPVAQELHQLADVVVTIGPDWLGAMLTTRAGQHVTSSHRAA
ncbi:MAG: NYN domain-containing protein [Streptosporangiales bacterium]|nr:NYN domain-containing protein [Streptosporangiales bacterium]